MKHYLATRSLSVPNGAFGRASLHCFVLLCIFGRHDAGNLDAYILTFSDKNMRLAPTFRWVDKRPNPLNRALQRPFQMLRVYFWPDPKVKAGEGNGAGRQILHSGFSICSSSPYLTTYNKCLYIRGLLFRLVVFSKHM